MRKFIAGGSLLVAALFLGQPVWAHGDPESRKPPTSPVGTARANAEAMRAVLQQIDRAALLRVESRPQPPAGLQDFRIVLSAGHGRTWNESSEWWGWQRDVVHGGEVEDLITPRLVNRWLAEYFENAGANVVLTRERDEQLHEVRLDDTATSTVVQGQWTLVQDASGTDLAPYEGTALTAATTTDGAGGSVTFHADIPETDQYGLRIWYPEVGSATSNARLVIHTAAGDVLAEIDQRYNQGRWLWIDQFVFPSGTNVPIATMTTASSDPGKTVVADAIRLGGGMGDYDRGGGVSGLPRWQEFSKGWAITYGAPSWVWDEFVVASDYSVRQNYIFWEPTDFFYEIHSNAAANGSGVQTGTQIVWTQATDQAALDRVRAGHDNMLALLRERWLASWRNDGFNSASSGYSYNASLVEVAYHDRLEPDLISLLDPDFRQLAMRALYETIATTLNGADAVLIPEPPEAPAASNLGNGAVRLRWQPPSWGPAVTHYRVYTSSDGLSYDLGQDVGDVTSYDIEGLDAGAVRYFQIRALNEGGRSFPTETIGVRVGDGDPLLVVNGFDRLDREVQEPDNPRHFVRDYITAFGAADPQLAIDSAANEAITEEVVSLGAAEQVAWILGKESLEDETFSPSEQAALASFLNGGGRLFVSGTDIARDLLQEGTTEGATFASTSLFLGSTGARTSSNTVRGAEGTAFAGLELDLSGPGEKPYAVEQADVLAVDLSGRPVLEWADGSGAAALAYDAGPGKVLAMAAPFEALGPAPEKAELAAAVLDFLNAPVTPDQTGPQVINLSISNIGPAGATIRWSTDEPAMTTLEGGQTTDGAITVPVSTELVRQHRIGLSGLEPSTTYFYRVANTDFFGNASVTEWQEFTTAAPDTSPPVISDGEVVGASDRDAIVAFMTNEPAIASAIFGPANNPLAHTALSDGEYRQFHVLRVAPLQAGTAHTVSLRAEDLSGNQAEPHALQLTALAALPDFIVDNGDPGYSQSGAWSTGSFGTQFFGSNYRFASAAVGGTSTAAWEAALPLDGLYQAAVIYPAGGNRSNAAPYIVSFDGGEQLFPVNQQTGGGVWQALGEPLPYDAAVPARMVLSNNTSASGVVMADAVRWQFVQLLESVAFQQEPDNAWMIY